MLSLILIDPGIHYFFGRVGRLRSLCVGSVGWAAYESFGELESNALN